MPLLVTTTAQHQIMSYRPAVYPDKPLSMVLRHAVYNGLARKPPVMYYSEFRRAVFSGESRTVVFRQTRSGSQGIYVAVPAEGQLTCRVTSVSHTLLEAGVRPLDYVTGINGRHTYGKTYGWLINALCAGNEGDPMTLKLWSPHNTLLTHRSWKPGMWLMWKAM